MSTEDGPSHRMLIGTAVFGTIAALAVLLGILKYVQHHDNSQPVTVAFVPAPQAGSPGCQAMAKGYPGDLAGGWKRATVRDPAPPASAAWRRDDATIIARCGLDRPAEFVVGTAVEQVNGVQWLRLVDPSLRSSTWLAVDRGVYIALTVPDGSGPDPITQMSDAISDTLPAVKPTPNPPPH